MTTNWEFPSQDVVLENEAVSLSAIKLEDDLVPLFEAASMANNRSDLFQYHVNVPPMTDLVTFENYLVNKLKQPSEVAYKVFSKRLGAVVGSASLMNIKQAHGVLEVGSIWYSKKAQRTEINTNAMHLLFCYVFEVLGYRRLEWKCHSKNQASMDAAVRLGFVYEGLFRQHFVSRGENRDTVWYSILDSEWSEKKRKLEDKMRPRPPQPKRAESS